MSIGFLVESDQPIVWRGPMASKAMHQLIEDTLWEEIDYLIVDLPPGTGDIHITIAQQFPLTGAVIVTTPQEVSLADARKAAAMLVSPHIKVPLIGVVENMSYFVPPDDLSKKYYIFGKDGGSKLAVEFSIPLLGQIPITEAIRSGADEGTPAAISGNKVLEEAFLNLASRVGQQISILNAKIPLRV